MMEFPDWVEGPTACKTRTFSLSLAIDPKDQKTRNRYPTKLVRSLPNVAPVIPIRNKENGKLYPHYVTLPLPDGFELVTD